MKKKILFHIRPEFIFFPAPRDEEAPSPAAHGLAAAVRRAVGGRGERGRRLDGPGARFTNC
jgi:hypothetical protein